MISFLTKVIKTVTFQQSLLTSSTTLVNGVLGALFYIIVARVLGATEFGLFILAVTTLTLLADITDLGLNTSLIKFVSANIKQNSTKAFSIIKLVIQLKVLILLLVAIGGYLLADVIALYIFYKPELSSLLRLVFILLSGSSLFLFTSSLLQALQKYRLWSVINIFVNALRLLSTLVLVDTGNLSLINVLLVYLVAPLIGVLLTIFLLPYHRYLTVKQEKSLFRDVFSYTKWVALFIFLAALSSRLDTFISGRLLSSSDVGIYGSANQLVSFIPQIIGAIGAVMAPKFASFSNTQQMLRYLKKSELMMSGIATALLVSLPFVTILLPIILGPSYKDINPIFIILLISMVIFLIAAPIHNSIIYFYSYPRLFTYLSVIDLLIVGLVGYYLIESYGLIGAATAVFITQLVNLIIPLSWLIFKIRK